MLDSGLGPKLFQVLSVLASGDMLVAYSELISQTSSIVREASHCIPLWHSRMLLKFNCRGVEVKFTAGEMRLSDSVPESFSDLI